MMERQTTETLATETLATETLATLRRITWCPAYASWVELWKRAVGLGQQHAVEGRQGYDGPGRAAKVQTVDLEARIQDRDAEIPRELVDDERRELAT